MAAVQSLMVASTILLFHVVSASVAELSTPEHDAFHSFMHQYSREYKKGSDEYHQRLALFSQRVAEAQVHNANPDRLWTAGVNRLSDRTEDELAGLRGWNGAAAGAGSKSSWRYGSGTFLSQRSRGRSLPQEFTNWTSLTSAKGALDQGGCGSCWAVAAISILAQHHEIYNPQSKRTFSLQELVSCVPNPHKCGGSGGCDGATVELALHWAMNQGLAEDSETPYSATNGECKKTVGHSFMELGKGNQNELSVEELTSVGVHRAAAGAGGLAFGMQAWERLPENQYEPLLRAVYEHGPVGVSVDGSRWSQYSSGIFDACQRDAVISHAVVLVGYGKDAKLDKPFYLIQNSWGADWGESGYIRLLRSDGDGEYCGIDHQPEVGTACTGGPKQVKVCGMCGILYDSSLPHFKHVAP